MGYSNANIFCHLIWKYILVKWQFRRINGIKAATILVDYYYVLQVRSHIMLGIPKHEEVPSTPQRPLSAMGEACSRMDLTAIHQILVATHYRDDEGTNEVTDGCIGFKFTIFGWMICHKV